MQSEVNAEMLGLARDLSEAQKRISIHQMAHAHLLCLLLNVIDRSAQQKIKQILQAQVSSGELHGIAAESFQHALDLVSLVTDPAAPPDPKSLLRLIQGGKEP